MKKRLMLPLLMVLSMHLSTPTTSYSQVPCCLVPLEQMAFLNEHLVFGFPGGQASLFVRKGYVTSYDVQRRLPRWVAYRVIPEYLDTPDRKISRFGRFRTDPDIDNPVVRGDYTNQGYDRGHLAPFNVMGGDRDKDGALAEDDPHDAQTVFEANFMSNMAPQHPTAFNRAGIWRDLERWIQNTLVRDNRMEVWVVAGTIFGPGETEMIGPDDDIAVPPLFYKMVITKEKDGTPRVLAFLMPHHRARHGSIEDFLVSVDIIETLTGLDFFNELEDDQEKAFEMTDTWETWEAHFMDLNGPVATMN